MTALETLLILSALCAAPTEDRHPEAVEVYSCDFEEASDVDYDLWPDRWTRRRGRGYPAYLKVEITPQKDEPVSPGGNSLRCTLDGGAIAAFSPYLPISSEFSYILEAYLSAENLKNDVAYYAITFCDAKRRPLETVESEKFHATDGWKQVRIGPLTPTNREAQFAIIELHVRPEKEADVRGVVRFDDIWFGRFPLVSLAANSDQHFYTDGTNVKITCRASGLSDANSVINFELLDHFGNQLAHEGLPLVADAPTNDMRDMTGLPAKESAKVLVGVAEWTPPVTTPGFYRVRVAMPGPSGNLIRRDLNYIVSPPNPLYYNGEFGWSLSECEEPLNLRALASLTKHVGINWLKLPIWFDGKTGDTELPDRLGSFVERIDAHHIQVVGVLDQPPGEIRDLFEDKGKLPVASVFIDKTFWRPAIDPVMMRMSLKVRWWQLGRDDDTSFVEFPNLESRIQEIKQHVGRFGQNVAVGFPWQATADLPISSSPPWDFISHTASPPLTSNEIVNNVPHSDQANSRNWITLRTLPKSEYDLETRASDLVARMVSAKIIGSNGIFLTEPFDPECGIMQSDGQPGELLLPWRIASNHLTDTTYEGNFTMPEGSYNEVFSRGNDAVMVVWSDVPTTERLYLGENVEQVDVWGKTEKVPTEVENGRPVQRLEVGRTPTFIRGINLAIAKWRMKFRFEDDRLASIFGREQPAPFRFENPFPQGVSGDVSFSGPRNWDITPKKQMFKVGMGEDRADALTINLRSDASSGDQRIRADFRVVTDREYFFSVYSGLRVGLDDISVELATRTDDAGNLIVDQHLVNQTDRFVSFNCLLFVPDRRRHRRQIFNLGHGRTTISYVLPNASELIGKTIWLRLEEMGGVRVLNYHVVAEP